MKKVFIFVGICLLAVLLTACGGQKNATPTGQPKAESISGSILDLLKLGKSSKCVLSAKTDQTITSGTTYLSNNKARSDYEMTGPDGKAIAGHFISDGTWMYTWTEGAYAQAIKFKLDQMPTPGVEGQAQDVSNLQDKMDYKCYGWAADQSVFVPPANINFTDYSELLKKLQNSIPGGTSALCAQCDKVSDAAAKAQCKSSLGCK